MNQDNNVNPYEEQEYLLRSEGTVERKVGEALIALQTRLQYFEASVKTGMQSMNEKIDQVQSDIKVQDYNSKLIRLENKVDNLSTEVTRLSQSETKKRDNTGEFTRSIILVVLTFLITSIMTTAFEAVKRPINTSTPATSTK